MPTGLAFASGCVNVVPFLALLAGVSIAVYSVLSASCSPSEPVAPQPTAQAKSPTKATELWDSSVPFICGANKDITLEDHTIEVPGGVAITFEPRCHLKLVRCFVKGRVAIDMGDAFDSTLEAEDSTIDGDEIAVRPSFSSHIDAVRSFAHGLVLMNRGQRSLLHGLTAMAVTDIPGAPRAVDPTTLVGIARSIAGLGDQAALAQIDGVFVGSNGLVDLDSSTHKGRIHYRFELPPFRLTDDSRSRAAPAEVRFATSQARANRLFRTVTVDGDGIRLEEASASATAGVGVDVAPHCSFHQVWAAARTGDVPEDVLAHIMYSSDEHGQGWWFHVDDTQFTFSISAATCKR
jgi:hypothetical protein